MSNSMSHEIRLIGVIGAGQMGAGIAQVAAHAGYDVLLSDVSKSFAENAKTKIASQLKKQVEKQKMTEVDATALINRIKPV